MGIGAAGGVVAGGAALGAALEVPLGAAGALPFAGMG